MGCGWRGTGAGLAEESDGRPVPKLVCEEPEYAFGELDNRQDILHDFVIRNEGEAPLKILQVKLPCGCMLLRLMDDVIQPGDETILRAKFPLKGRNGPQRKRIVLLTNDPAQPRLTLCLTGVAIAELEVRPSRLFWGHVRENDSAEKTVEVIFRDEEEFHVVGVQSPMPTFAVDTETVTDGLPAVAARQALQAGQSYRIRVRAVPPLPRGAFQASLKIRTDHPRFETIDVPMSGRVVGDLYTVPDELVLAPTHEPVSRTLMVYSSRKQNFKVLRVDPPGTNIEVKIRSTLFSGTRVELRNIVPTPELDGRHILITTDAEAMKELSVPIRIRVPDAGRPESP